MDRLQSYRDLCKEIELWEIRLWDLEQEKRLLLKQMITPPQAKLCANYDGIPGAGMMVLDFPKAWSESVDIERRINECKDVLSLKREAKKRMESVMGQMDKLEYKVAYMRDIEQMKLEDIAKKLDYSYDWIRKISTRVKRVREKVPS